MKRIYLIVLCLLSGILLLVANCAKENNTGLKLSWTIEKQNGKPVHIFTIRNMDTKPLDNNWTIYFNQGHPHYQQLADSPIKIDHLGGTYFKMYPTDKYHPIKDSLVLTLPVGVAKNKISFFPEGVYLVTSNEKGEYSQPVSIDVEIKNTELYNIDDPHLMYPNAERLYNENDLFISPVSLTEYDIIPSLKAVNRTEEKMVFEKSVQIQYDKGLENEATLLEARLKKNYGCTISDKAATKIVLKVKSESKYINDEHYFMHITAEGILIDGATPHAVFNATQSLLAILGHNRLPFQINGADIEDYPDLLYRGQMLDVSRNFTTKENLLHLIDALSLYKINRLHLHLTDDEGWRIEIPGIEELTTVGATRGHTLDESAYLFPAYGGGWNPHAQESLATGYYTKKDFVEILKYANERHIKIIPEIDFPGHSRAAIKATNARYNKYITTDKTKAEEFLLADFDDASVYNSAQDYNDNVMNIALASSYRFVQKVIDEIEKMYGEAGLKFTQIHLGGDEIPEGAWLGSPVIRKFMQEKNLKTAQDLKDYFIIQVSDILSKKGVQMLGWQEFMLLANHEVNKNMENRDILSYCWNTVPEWGGDEIPYRLANTEHPIILCNVTNFYFDLAYNKGVNEPGHDWGGYVNEYTSFNMVPYNIYKSVRVSGAGTPMDVFSYGKDKLQLQASGRDQIKGVQGQLWSETIRSYNLVEYYLFPKMLGLVERGWNAIPIWQDDSNDERYKQDLAKYNEKIMDREFPRLSLFGINYRLPQPGISIKEGKLYINCAKKDVELRYTLDGTEPTLSSSLWSEPISYNAALIKAKAFYGGKSSVATIYKP